MQFLTSSRAHHFVVSLTRRSSARSIQNVGATASSVESSSGRYRYGLYRTSSGHNVLFP